jgi:general secretion pathway protein H
MQRQRGLTLLELLVVLAIVAVSSAGVALAMRDNAHAQLEREGQRLIAILEAARAQSRARGVAMVWFYNDKGFVVQPAAPNAADGKVQQEAWLHPGLSVRIGYYGNAEVERNSPARLGSDNNLLALGPEPIIPARTITLSQVVSPSDGAAVKPLSLRIGTDGLQPFHRLP